MRALILSAFLLMPALAAAADPALLRSTLIVADVDRSIAFYGRLGFVVESDRAGPRKPDSPFPLASRSSTFRLVILKSGDLVLKGDHEVIHPLLI